MRPFAVLQRNKLLQAVYQIISITSSDLFKKLRRELGVLLGRRNCVIKYMGKKEVHAQIPKSFAVLDEGFL